MSSRFGFVTGLLGATLGALVGCSSDANERAALAQLGGTCLINSDCAESLICAFKLCHDACDTSRDCQHGQRCVEGPKSHNVCQLPEEQSCSKFGGCAGNQACGVDAECRDRCTTAQDCIGEQVCVSGTCADQTELNASGALESSAARPAVAAPCSYNSDCPEKQLCQSGSCRPGCSADRDCDSGQTCQNGSCAAPPKVTGCVYDSDCAEGQRCASGDCQAIPMAPAPECASSQDCTHAGEHCQAGRCLCECAADADCARGQSCQDGCQCVASGVLNGDVDVHDLAQLAELENVVQITGRLSIRISGVTTVLHLPTLRTVGGVWVNPEHGGTISVSFDALTSATGAVDCGVAICTFPKLHDAGDLTLTADEKLSLPALQKAGTVRISGKSLVEVSLPMLDNAAAIQLQSLPALATVELGALTTLTNAFSVSYVNPALALSLPQLKAAGGFGVYESLGALSLPSLASGNFSLAHSSVTELSLPSLLTLSSFSLDTNPELASVSLPKLGSVPGSVSFFTIDNVPKLTELDVPSLTSIDVLLSLSNTGLVDLTSVDPDTQPVHGSLTNAGTISIMNNLALSSCLVTAFEQHLKNNHQWPYTISSSGNLDPPVGGCP